MSTGQGKVIGLDENSPSVQIHLGIIQGVIQRMGANSTACKTWCISIVSAMLVVMADKAKADLMFLAFLPTFLFMCLDAYYLALEKGFRERYNDFVMKLHDKTLAPSDLYSIGPKGNMNAHQRTALKSMSVWGLYVPLVCLIFCAWHFVGRVIR